MKKSDLKSGMRVMTRNGYVYLVIRDYETGFQNEKFILVRNGGWIPESEYNDDLTSPIKAMDIIEIFTLEENRSIGDDILNLSQRHSIWKRDNLQDNLRTIFQLNDWMREPVADCLDMHEEMRLAVYHTFNALKVSHNTNRLLPILNNIVKPEPYKG